MNACETAEVTMEELDRILQAPRGPRIEPSAWVQRFAETSDAGLSDFHLGELATETPTGCRVATIQGLCEGLARKYGDDGTTAAALMAIAYYHLPNLIEYGPLSR